MQIRLHTLVGRFLVPTVLLAAIEVVFGQNVLPFAPNDDPWISDDPSEHLSELKGDQLSPRNRYKAAEERVRDSVQSTRAIRNLVSRANQGDDKVQIGAADRGRLRDVVRQAFEARQDLLREEIAEFHKRLDRLNHALNDRERAKDSIIERRVDELLNPNVQWDADNQDLNQVQNRSAAGVRSINPASGMGRQPGSRMGSGGPHSSLKDIPTGPNSTNRNSPVAATANPDDAGADAGERSTIRVFPLKRAQAEQVATILTELSGPMSFVGKISADSRTNSIVVVGRVGDLSIIADIIKRLEKPDSFPSENAPPPLGGVESGSPAVRACLKITFTN